MKLKNKIAIVTGGAQGLGEAIVVRLAHEGAHVIIWDLQTEKAQNLAQQLNNEGFSVEVMENIDIISLDSVENAAKEIIKKHQKIDILVNNAGIIRDASMKKMTLEQWQSVIDVNLNAVFCCTKAVLPAMVAQNSGKIVNISSVVGIYGNFGQSNYVASKSAIIGLTKTWARELGKNGINVNAIAPGAIETPILATVPAEIKAQFVAKIAVGRIGQPEDIANTCLFLVSEEASFITGQTITVDGGAYLG